MWPLNHLLHTALFMSQNASISILIIIRVESELNDPENLGHFFRGSSGSHLQTKLSGCDPDITCSLENSVGIWYTSE